MNYSKIRAKGLLTLCLFAGAFATPAMAAQYSCTGPVSGVTVTPNGVVSAVNIAGLQWGFLCEVDSTANNIEASTCKSILAVLLAAQAAGKHVTIWYDDNRTCSTQPSWNWASTWYWGPALAD